MPLRTHYDNLKVSRDAPEKVIKSAFKALSLLHHPDRSNDRFEANETFKIILKSYEILVNPESRREHDKWIAKQEALSQNEKAEWHQTKKKAATDTTPTIPKYIQTIISLHTSISTFFQYIFASTKAMCRWITYPAALFGIFVIVSTYQMWSWSQTGAINSFLDRFLERKAELGSVVELIDDSNLASLPIF